MNNLTREQRPPGSPGWIYDQGTELPKGEFIEVLDEPLTFWHGGVARKIRWTSNGEGLPSMQLIGTPGDLTTPENARRAAEMAKLDIYAVPAGAYQLPKMGQGTATAKKEPK